MLWEPKTLAPVWVPPKKAKTEDDQRAKAKQVARRRAKRKAAKASRKEQR